VTVDPESGEFVTQFDLPIMRETYATHRNYEVVDGGGAGAPCFIFFSSHGIYYPNTVEEFQRSIVMGDRFEWRRYSPREGVRKIFVRDVTKQWYLNGISAEHDSVQRVKTLLEEQAGGRPIICVGSSAGGFAAVLFGCLLGASHVFSFSGQFSLWHLLENERNRRLNPTLTEHEHDPSLTRYFSVLELADSTATPVFYLYPARCDEDVLQNRLASQVASIHPFAFDSGEHAVTCAASDYEHLFSLALPGLLELHDRCGDRVMSQFSFSRRTVGLRRSLGREARAAAKRWLKGR
jgi:hypothetical protein